MTMNSSKLTMSACYMTPAMHDDNGSLFNADAVRNNELCDNYVNPGVFF